MTYTIQVSNHPQAGKRIPSQAAADSWQTLYDGAIATPDEARKACDDLAAWYRHVRCFRGTTVGTLWYGNLGA